MPGEEEVADRLAIKRILIQLRKRVYSTLREISFIVNNIRTLEGDLEVRKISEVFMRDGGTPPPNAGSGERKLEAIEALVLAEARLTRTPPPTQARSSNTPATTTSRTISKSASCWRASERTSTSPSRA